jgi:hypothetical protein
MADFYQTGVIATFHRLGMIDTENIETELTWHVHGRRIVLVLPYLYSELEGDALKGIVREQTGECGFALYEEYYLKGQWEVARLFDEIIEYPCRLSEYD